MTDYGDIVDSSVFDQLLEMDDDENRDFSKGIAKDYMTQAETTLLELDDSLGKMDLESLGRLGHFMKGSSAALGLQKIRETCEQIQNYGRKVDSSGEPLALSDDVLMEKLGELVKDARTQYNEAREWLNKFYKL
ncbi:signal transduction histidine kinase [Obelidium mucronatum]|nr:signal transduction histidine kinase [Obelidium mucronatum]